jgi:hypothetical protein
MQPSFLSHWVAEVPNAALVALEAGNSPQMIFRHCREVMRPADARAWFGITPEAAKAVRERIETKQAARVVAFPARAVA